MTRGMGRGYLTIIAGTLLILGSAAPAFAVPESARISALAVEDSSDDESNARFSVDTAQGSCEAGDEDTAEPFFDTIVGMKVVNSGHSSVQFQRASFRIRGSGGPFRSKAFPLITQSEVAPGESVQLRAFFLKASGGGKVLAGTSKAVGALGFRTVIAKLRGRFTNGKAVVISARTTMSFDDFDRCSP